MKRTTELKELKNGAAFNWGEMIKIHEVGPYSIVECFPWTRTGCEVNTGQSNRSKASFHGYVNQKDTCHAWESLDAALAGCIAYRCEGPNHRADGYFIKMIAEPA